MIKENTAEIESKLETQDMLKQNASNTMARNRTPAGRSAGFHTGNLQAQGKREKSNIAKRKNVMLHAKLRQSERTHGLE